MEVKDYIDENSRNHYREWFTGLAAAAAAKVATAVARMASGNTSGLKPLGPGLAEWRIDWGPGLRIYVHQDGKELIVLLGGSDKGDQQAEIKAAVELVEEYKRRKKLAAIAAQTAAKAKPGKASQGSKHHRKKHK